jgi:pimeloyl-ACP methyl ester carboxylesterase
MSQPREKKTVQMNIAMSIRQVVQTCTLALSLLILLPTIATASPPPGIPDGWSDGYAYANGIRIHYYRAAPASGKPVIVMVHGVTDNGLCWTTLTWKLEKDYDIYMIDTRGHGLTDPFTPSDDGDTLIKDVVEFVKAMKFEKPILMGHSMGGATVIRVGAEYPDLAKAIIVLDAGIGGPRGGRPGARGETNAPARTQVNATARTAEPVASAERSERSATTTAQSTERRGSPERAASAPDNLSFNMFGSPETLVAQNNYKFEDLVATGQRRHPKWDFVDNQYWALSKKQYHGAYSSETFRVVMQGSMRTGDSLAKIPVPMIILKADASPEARKAHEDAAKVMQKGKLVHIDGAGHNLHHDELNRTVEVLKEFLSTLQ